MKILLLADANSPHTIKWVQGLVNKGIFVALWSISKPKEGIYQDVNNLKIYSTELNQRRYGLLSKVRYLTQISHLKAIVREFEPDLVHAHFASSYGLLGALTGFHPFFISVWGSDIFDFPTSNLLFNKIIKFNLNRADKILSTSHIMALETSKFTKKEIEVTPFGIDLEVFKKNRKWKNSKKFVVGTIKTLEEKYGIKYLIEAFNVFHKKYPNVEKELLIVGGGSLKEELVNLVYSLGIENISTFTGRVPYSEVPNYHNLLDVCCCLSILDSESFGVAAIESSAVENPVIVSNVGGLPEVIIDGKTGIVVPPKDSKKAAEAIEALYLNKELRIKMGVEGRKYVENHYNWENNLQTMIDLYKEALRK